MKNFFSTHNAAWRRAAPYLVALAVGVAVLLTLVLKNPVTHPPGATSNAGVEKLHIALPVAPQSGLLQIAHEKGYFAEEGLDVKFMPISHGKVGIDLVLEGKVDLTVAAEVPFVIAAVKGGELSMVANLLDMPNGNAVIARRDRGIATATDLAGKRIGVSMGTSGEYNLWAFLVRHKLAPDSVAPVDVPPGRIAQEIASGNVDAIVTWKPLLFDAQAALGGNALVLESEGEYTQLNILVGRSAFLAGHPGAIKRLIQALLKAEEFTHAQPDAALTLVSRWTSTEPKVLEPLWKEFDFRISLLQSHLITLEDEARWAMARGYVAPGPVPNLLPHIYVDALLAVRPGRVSIIR